MLNIYRVLDYVDDIIFDRLWYVGFLFKIYCYDMNYLIIMYLIRYVCLNIKLLKIVDV